MDSYRKTSKEWGSKARKQESRQRKSAERAKAVREAAKELGDSPFTWTKPFHGVQHLKEPKLPSTHQATVTEYGADLSEASLFDTRNYQALHEKSFKTAAEARAWLEKKVAGLLGWDLIELRPEKP